MTDITRKSTSYQSCLASLAVLTWPGTHGTGRLVQMIGTPGQDRRLPMAARLRAYLAVLGSHILSRFTHGTGN
jgi:hypothetical protein